LIGSAAMAQPYQCDMTLSFRQPDDQGKRSVAVWQSSKGSGLLFADTMNINTDGTSRSYSVGDFWGEKVALNNLCNAMTDACGGLSKDGMQARRVATQTARAHGWPASETAATRISPSIIPFKNGKPCPEVGGFLVSATSLHKARITDPCDITSYADALTVPAIVIPKRRKGAGPTPFEQAGASVGDLAVMMSADGKLIKYAVIGDTGPYNSLGEVSLALASDLNGRLLPPKNYQEVRGRGEFRGRGWHVGKTYTLILSHTRNAANPYITRDRIERDAATAFTNWGGAGRLKACAATYRP